jgi:C4-dicarboxylate-specific signal transduction histidine kinase
MRRPIQNEELVKTVHELLTIQPVQIPVNQPDLDERRYLKEHVNRLTQALEDKVVALKKVMQQNALLLKDSKHHEAELEKSLSELQDTQSYLVQSERLSAVGQLVAGGAHELNNPLAIIIGYAQLVLRMPEVTPRMEECLNKLKDAGQRCQRIVHHLTIFVTGDTVRRDTLSFIEKTEKPYLTKPFYIERIRQVVAYRLSDN